MVTDFRLARATAKKDRRQHFVRMAEDSEMVGTAAFMAPEQVTGHRVGVSRFYRPAPLLPPVVGDPVQSTTGEGLEIEPSFSADGSLLVYEPSETVGDLWRVEVQESSHQP